MNHPFLILLAFIMPLASCNDHNVAMHKVTPRNTTITPVNAYTHLVLDSNAVQNFINNQVKDNETGLKIKNFYNVRNYQYAWFNEEGLTEQAEVFWSLHQKRMNEFNDSSLYNKILHYRMEILLNEDTTYNEDISLQPIELGLTLHFFKYIRTAFNGKISPEEMQWHIPRRKMNERAMLDSFLTGKQKNWRPLNRSFYRLQSKLQQYAAVVKRGGWEVIKWEKSRLKKGSKGASVTQLKRRLIASGDYPAGDTSNRFTAQLKETVKQMMINLERMQWMPEENYNRIVANIPEYKLHVYEKDAEVMNMKIVVGKAANRTLIFSDELKYIVFSPYWNVPRSIIRNEILPAINRNKGYLQRNHMEITGYRNGLPVVRQKPVRGNALGKVKFIFPNRYNIYFHDTPAKALFNWQKRAFSHGCIRLSQPFELAKYLLSNEADWPPYKIRKAMNQRTEKWVTLKQPVPVLIVYFTSWVDDDGLLHFREDVYGHDDRMAQHLFE